MAHKLNSLAVGNDSSSPVRALRSALLVAPSTLSLPGICSLQTKEFYLGHEQMTWN